MKRLSLSSFVIAIVCLTVCCSPDNPVATVSSTDLEVESQYTMRGTEQLPDNAANEYDAAGLLYSEITQAFLDLDSVSSSMSTTIETVEDLADGYPDFLALRPINYTSPTATQINAILADEQTSMAAIISNSPLSLKAKENLELFIDSVMVYRQNDTAFDTVYDYIVDFEASIVRDTDYTLTDRKILLTTTSITRHGFYFKRKKKWPRDRDWDISWGSITAGTQGSTESQAKAVIMSVVTGIGLNN